MPSWRTTARRSSATGSGRSTRGGRCTPSSSTTRRRCPLHVHHRDEHAAALGKKGKPEAYYFAPQMNSHLGELGITFFGLHPETTRAQLAERLARFADGGDNRITELSRGYRIQLGTGWDVPAGVLHAPASVCTYEPQRASDVACLCESWSNGREVMSELLWKDVPHGSGGRRRLHRRAARLGAERRPTLLDQEPDGARSRRGRRRPPATTGSSAGWSTSHRSSAQRSSRSSRASTVTVRDTDAYGCIVVQGTGSLNGHAIASPTIIRYGQLTEDEYFVSEAGRPRGRDDHQPEPAPSPW